MRIHYFRRAGSLLPVFALLRQPVFLFCFGILFGLSVMYCDQGLAEQMAELRVCLLEENLPLSSRKKGIGFDVDTAKAVATALERSFVPVWTKNSTRIIEVEESDFPLHKLARNECDAIFSIPGEEAIKDAPKVVLGAPYYGAAFELVGRGTDLPKTLEAIGDTPVAVQAQTIANFVLSARKAHIRTFFSVPAALAGVAKGEAAVALLWGPLTGWHLHNHPELDLKIVSDYTPLPVVCWNEHVATRQSDAALREAINAALKQLHANGTLKTLMEKYGIPPHTPFAATYSVVAMQQLQ